MLREQWGALSLSPFLPLTLCLVWSKSSQLALRRFVSLATNSVLQSFWSDSGVAGWFDSSLVALDFVNLWIKR